jgi:shikimate kinase
VTGPVFLLGMMGAGKSSVARLLARARGAVFIDLDERMELLFGRSIARLYEQGESRFRALERAALRSLVDEPGFATASAQSPGSSRAQIQAAVVATGGGIVCDPDNLETMLSVGRLVYLEVDVATLCARLCLPAQRDTRPLLGDHTNSPGGLAARLTELLAAREPNYRRASLIVDARGSPEQVAARLQELL